MKEINFFSEQDRIEQFNKTMCYCMPDRFKREFVDDLRGMGFLPPPLPFTTTALMKGRCSITA